VAPKLVHCHFNNLYNTTLNIPKIRVIPPNVAASTPIVQPFLEIINSRGDCFDHRSTSRPAALPGAR
jgi:hypothetical protein